MKTLSEQLRNIEGQARRVMLSGVILTALTLIIAAALFWYGGFSGRAVFLTGAAELLNTAPRIGLIGLGAGFVTDVLVKRGSRKDT